MAVKHVTSSDNVTTTNRHTDADSPIDTLAGISIDYPHHHAANAITPPSPSPTPSTTSSSSSSDADVETCPFEGPEKLLEIWFAPSASDVPDARTAPPGRSGLRGVDRKVWEDMLDIVKCKILSVVRGREVDAYLLSESSLFISPHRLILKTCGTTLNLLGLPRILHIARTLAHLPHIHHAFYSRKSFMFPERQLGPHREWKSEVEFLEGVFGGGRAYTVGRVNGDYWLLYLMECGGGCVGQGAIGGLGGEWTYVPVPSSPSPSLSGYVATSTGPGPGSGPTHSLANSFYSSTSSASSTSALSSSALASSTTTSTSTSTSTSDDTPLKPWGGRGQTFTIHPQHHTQTQSLSSSYSSVHPSAGLGPGPGPGLELGKGLGKGSGLGMGMGLPMSPSAEQDYTIEILMTHLSARARGAFFTPKLRHGGGGDGGDAGDGDGDNSNANSGVDTNDDDDDNDQDQDRDQGQETGTQTPAAYAQHLSDRLGISDLFPREVTRLDAYAFTPCGYSSNALLAWGRRPEGGDRNADGRPDVDVSKEDVSKEGEEGGGEGYYTIHVTPEEGWSYASFECNVPLPTFPPCPKTKTKTSAIPASRNDKDKDRDKERGKDKDKEIPDLQTLIQRVVRIFEPGRITMTLFISSASKEDEDGDEEEDSDGDGGYEDLDRGGGSEQSESGENSDVGSEAGYVDAGAGVGAAKSGSNANHNSKTNTKSTPESHGPAIETQTQTQTQTQTETAIELAQRVFKSALMKVPARVQVEGESGVGLGLESPSASLNSSANSNSKYLRYRRTDKINYEFGGYDLAFASFELRGGVGEGTFER